MSRQAESEGYKIHYPLLNSQHICRNESTRGIVLSSAHLEELTQGLDEGELEVFGEAAHVVVGLDHVAVLLPRARGRAGLDDIRVQRSLPRHPLLSEVHPKIKDSILIFSRG